MMKLITLWAACVVSVLVAVTKKAIALNHLSNFVAQMRQMPV